MADTIDTLGDALELFEQWSRKYYRWSIVFSGGVQPGDGVTVTLEGGGRKVTVGDYELEVHPDDDETSAHYPTIGEVIKEALHRWYADTSPKRYRLLWSDGEKDPPIGALWSSFGKSTVVHIEVSATTEAEAIQHVQAAYRKVGRMVPTKISVWELAQPK